MRTALFRTSRIELREKNRIYVIPEQDDIFCKDDILELLSMFYGLVEGKRFTILMHLLHNEIMLTKGARNVFKNNINVQKSIIGEAILTRSRSTMILFNLVIQVYPPTFPLKAFKDEKEANEWLDSL